MHRLRLQGLQAGSLHLGGLTPPFPCKRNASDFMLVYGIQSHQPTVLVTPFPP
jgi:hypothetical protein